MIVGLPCFLALLWIIRENTDTLEDLLNKLLKVVVREAVGTPAHGRAEDEACLREARER